MHQNNLRKNTMDQETITLSPYKKTIARLLLETQSVKLSPEQPFKWSSGWNSPIYCDNRNILSFAKERQIVKESFVNWFNDLDLSFDAVSGVATAGIAMGALIADALELPFSYVRSKSKGHGMGNQIEGTIRPGQKTLVVEDLISTGGSSIKAIEALREADVEVVGLCAIFTYGFPHAAENLYKSNVKTFCLSDYDTLLPEALAMDYIKDAELPNLQEWRKAPASWGN